MLQSPLHHHARVGGATVGDAGGESSDKETNAHMGCQSIAEHVFARLCRARRASDIACAASLVSARRAQGRHHHLERAWSERRSSERARDGSSNCACDTSTPAAAFARGCERRGRHWSVGEARRWSSRRVRSVFLCSVSLLSLMSKRSQAHRLPCGRALDRCDPRCPGCYCVADTTVLQARWAT